VAFYHNLQLRDGNHAKGVAVFSNGLKFIALIAPSICGINLFP
jgi:hypothetical protein